MASLDDGAKGLITKSYPQVNDVDNDPVKLSSGIFEEAEVRLKAHDHQE